MASLFAFALETNTVELAKFLKYTIIVILDTKIEKRTTLGEAIKGRISKTETHEFNQFKGVGSRVLLVAM
jgi:hypothetical protein